MERATPLEYDEPTAEAIRKLEAQIAGGRVRCTLRTSATVLGSWLGIIVVSAILEGRFRPSILLKEYLTVVIFTAASVPGSWNYLHRRLDNLKSGRTKGMNRETREIWFLWAAGAAASYLSSAALFRSRGDEVLALATTITLIGLVVVGWSGFRYLRMVWRTDPELHDSNINYFNAAFFWSPCFSLRFFPKSKFPNEFQTPGQLWHDSRLASAQLFLNLYVTLMPPANYWCTY